MNANSNNDWHDLPPQMLASLSRQAKRRNLMRRVTVASAFAFASIALGVGLYLPWSGLVVPNIGDPLIAGIRCSEVRAAMPELMAGTLDADRADRIAKHVELCPACRSLMSDSHAARREFSSGDATHPHFAQPIHGKTTTAIAIADSRNLSRR